MRKFAFCLWLLALCAACTLNQPEVIVITATFLPPTPTSEMQAATLPPLPEGTLMQPTPNPTREAPPRQASQDYVVQAGDTLNEIAEANGASVETMLSLNDLPNPDTLFVGQVLRLPALPTSEGSDLKLLPDSRLVRAPGSRDFDVEAFITSTPGFLRNARENLNDMIISGAEVVERVALEFSVDPRVLLALLEYRSQLLSNPNPSEDERDYALRAPPAATGFDRKGLYYQLAWAADQLNYGYYRWKYSTLNTLAFSDGTRILLARDLNAGTVGVQYMLSVNADYATWQHDTSMNGLLDTYLRYFGDPFVEAVEPLVPDELEQPTLAFPFPSGQVWYFTGGPHGGYGSGSAWSAVDFAPPDDITTVTSGCYISENYATAVAAGIIARIAEGTVILDLDGDGDESTGWTILYLHMSSLDRVQAGARVATGDRIGRPSCEGGFSTGTHMHIARRYNGEWIPVSCDECAAGIERPSLVMGGWTFYGLPGQEYQGGLVRGGEQRIAEQGRNVTENQVSW